MFLEIKKNNITKEDIQTSIALISQKIQNGDVDGLQVLAWVKSVEKVLAGIKSKVTESAIDEFERYAGEKTVEAYGFEFAQKEAGTRYDFSTTEKWCEIKAKEDEIAAQRKDLEKLIKPLKHSIEMIDEDSGEVITLNLPVKTSTTIIQATQKR